MRLGTVAHNRVQPSEETNPLTFPTHTRTVTIRRPRVARAGSTRAGGDGSRSDDEDGSSDASIMDDDIPAPARVCRGRGFCQRAKKIVGSEHAFSFLPAFHPNFAQTTRGLWRPGVPGTGSRPCVQPPCSRHAPWPCCAATRPTCRRSRLRVAGPCCWLGECAVCVCARAGSVCYGSTGSLNLPFPPLLSSDADGALRLWHVDDRRPVASAPTAHAPSGGILSVAVLPDGRAVSHGRDGGLRTWRLTPDPPSLHPLLTIATGAHGFCGAAVVAGPAAAALGHDRPAPRPRSLRPQAQTRPPPRSGAWTRGRAWGGWSSRRPPSRAAWRLRLCLWRAEGAVASPSPPPPA